MDKKQVEEAAAGFSGLFVFDEAHTVDHGLGNVADYVEVDERLVYVPIGSNVRDEDCYVIADEIESYVAEPIAVMLNAVRPLLAQVNALERQLDHERQMNKHLSDQYGTERLALIDRAEIDRANLEIKLKELADEKRRHVVTQQQLDKFISATAELTIERMQLKHQLADLVGEENVK